MSKNCIISLTGDPITVGHRDIIKRASKIFDKMHILIPERSSKRGSILSYEDRKLAIEQDLEDDEVKNFEVGPIHSGEALVDAAKRHRECRTIVRGLRNEQDLVYEMDMSSVNRMLDPEVETVYLPCKPELSFVSSSMVRELVALGKYEMAERFTSDRTLKLLKRATTRVVALTGGIACGKSTAREIFKARGWFVLDADEINRKHVLGSTSVLAEISDALQPYGEVDQLDPAKSIAKIVFSNQEARSKLESIAFPIIYKFIKDMCCNWRWTSSKKILVEVPLLFESHASQFNDLFDFSLCIYSPWNEAIKRLESTRGLSYEQAKARLDSQMPASAKADFCDYSICNDSSLENFKSKIIHVVDDLETRT